MYNTYVSIKIVRDFAKKHGHKRCAELLRATGYSLGEALHMLFDAQADEKVKSV